MTPPPKEFNPNSVAIIGAGTMGEAMALAFLSDKKCSKEDLILVEKRISKMDYFTSKGINVTTDVVEAVSKSKTIFLCVKPFDLNNILLQIRSVLRDEQLIVSIAAGITISSIEETLNKMNGVIRVMPNNCCIVKASATVYSLGKFATNEQATFVENLLSCLGIVSKCDEKLIDSFTGFAGSGPAYAYLFIQSLADGAVRNGIPREQAIQYAAQIAYGAGKLVLDSKKHPAYLIDAVMTPAGTTAEGLLALEKSAFRAHIIKAVTQATKRAQELGQGHGEIKYIYKKKHEKNLGSKPTKGFSSWNKNINFNALARITLFGLTRLAKK